MSAKNLVRSTFGAMLAFWACVSMGHAAPVTFLGSAGTRAASVTFDTSGSNLIVTLTNTSTADAGVPTDILSAVFFDLQGSPNLSVAGGSAVLAPGSIVINPPSPATDPSPPYPAGSVGSEWAFRDNISGGGLGAYGISSSGLTSPGDFGGGDRFITTNDLSNPASPDGIQYGITTAGDDPTTGNGGIQVPLIKNSVVFTLTGFSGTLTGSSVSNVRFQYGTALSEPSIPGSVVPEPSTIALALSALVPIGVVGLRRIRRRPETTVG